MSAPKIIRVVDFETTGTDPAEGAEVCEVGLCDMMPGSGFVHPPDSWLCWVSSMPPEVRAVHHITLEECLAGGEFPFVERDLVEQGQPTALAAHNAAFEAQFIGDLGVPLLCTYKAALRVWPEAPKHSNGVLRYWLEDQGLLELEPELALPAHRAGPDAYVTAHILKALFAAGATLEDMLAWTAEPALLPACPIGKFRGKPWAEVEEGFLSWMLRQDGMEADLKWNARRELDRRRSARG